jgi:homoserine acetyltransferase
MSEIKAADVLRMIEILAPIAVHAQEGLAEARRLGTLAGLSKEDLDAAEARFTKKYADPLTDPFEGVKP